MTKIPLRLSRRAVKQHFDRVPAQKWDYWFRHEKENGLFELRVKGPFEKAYYNSEALKEWLLTEGIYNPRDFETVAHGPSNGWSGLVVRSHALAE